MLRLHLPALLQQLLARAQFLLLPDASVRMYQLCTCSLVEACVQHLHRLASATAEWLSARQAHDRPN